MQIHEHGVAERNAHGPAVGLTVVARAVSVPSLPPRARREACGTERLESGAVAANKARIDTCICSVC